MDNQFSCFPRALKIKLAVGAALLLTSLVLYLYGVCGPAIRIHGGPLFHFQSQPVAYEFSVINILGLLRGHRNYFALGCIVVFSFTFPLIKFLLIIFSLVLATCCRPGTCSLFLPHKIIRLILVVSKYQFLDVFLFLLLMTFIDFFSISVEPLSAAYLYLCYCLLSILTAQWLCLCYAEALERRTLFSHPRFAGPLSSPLLPKQTSWLFAEVSNPGGKQITLSDCNGRTSPLRLTDFSTAHPTQGPAASSPRVLMTGSSLKSQQWGQHDTRRRSTEETCHFRPRFSSSITVDPPPQLHSLNHAQAREPVLQPNDRTASIVRRSYWATWNGTYICSLRRARVTTFAVRFLSLAYQAAICFFSRIGIFCLQLITMLHNIVASCLSCFGPPESEFAKCCFSECLARTFFLTMLLCISTFALFVCWVRPVLEVAVVPGQQKGFAIETSTRSLGDVFWRLYSTGNVLSGCGILLVFPILATFVMYAASLGTTAGACFLKWPAESYSPHASSSRRLAGAALHPNSASGSSGGATYVIKVLSYFSALTGDVAMPDVQSLGLLAIFFIVNSIDFFAARLPARARDQPNNAWERLFWSFSGFWAMLAFGVSASQVHRLSTSFKSYPQDISESPGDADVPIRLGEKPPQVDGVRSRYKGRQENMNRALGHRAAFFLDDALLAGPSESAGVLESLPEVGFEPGLLPGGRRRRNNRFLGVMVHGSLRVIVSLALLLPVWLEPVHVIDVNLLTLNDQLQSFVEYVSPSLVNILPQSIGNCFSKSHKAPSPCTGSQSLGIFRTSIYEAKARWVTGLKSAEIQSVRFNAAPESRIVLMMEGKIKTLSLSLRIGECLYGEASGKCPVIWDGTDACCKGDTTFALQIAVVCSSFFPYVSGAELLQMHISKLVVTEKVLGIFPVDVADITPVVEENVSKWVQAYLNPQNKWIHWTHGQTLSLIEFLNLVLLTNAPVGIKCPQVD